MLAGEGGLAQFVPVCTREGEGEGRARPITHAPGSSTGRPQPLTGTRRREEGAGRGGDTPTPRLDKASEARPAHPRHGCGHAQLDHTGARPAGEVYPQEPQEPRKPEPRHLDTPGEYRPPGARKLSPTRTTTAPGTPPATGRRARTGESRRPP